MIIKLDNGKMYFCNNGYELDVLRDIINDELGQDSIILLEHVTKEYRENADEEIAILTKEKEEQEREIECWITELRDVREELERIIKYVKKHTKADIEYKLCGLVDYINNML